jgi:hypothetical protein
MSISVPDELFKAISDQAGWRQITLECAVREALSEWLKTEKELKTELDMWQDARLETLNMVEESLD